MDDPCEEGAPVTHGGVTARDPDNGQFVSLTKLFERERTEHAQDHEHERAVAKETAQRMEREVEQTALRIDAAVKTALLAVSETARVHSDAHSKEHVAHERIHAVEKTQVDKAEAQMNKRLEGMNEFRAALQDQSNKAVSRELFDTQLDGIGARLNLIEKRMAYYAGAGAAVGAGAALIIRLLGVG